MRYLTTLFILTVWDLGTRAQNLVVNPGFESYNPSVFATTCVYLFADSTNVSGWFSAGVHAMDSTHKCSSKSMYLSSAPKVLKPHGGKWMIGFTPTRLPQGTNWREYIVGKTVRSLAAGQTYLVTFFLSPHDGCEFGLDQMGIFFTPTIPFGHTFNKGFLITPQVTFSVKEITKKGHWESITVEYTATGAEQYFVIGNFRKDDATKLIPLGPDTPKADHWNWYAKTFYYIDDVSITPIASKQTKTLNFKH
jgi:OmpA-OmpF porin, OOP family